MGESAVEAVGRRGGHLPLIANRHGRFHKNLNEFGRMIRQWDVGVAKQFRKQFATRALELGIDETLIERAMGHAVSTLSRVSVNHYVAGVQAAAIAPVFKAVWESGLN